MIHTIEVENIKCGGCMNSIENALLKIDNVTEVTIDLETANVSVTAETDRAILVGALSKMGYPEIGHNSLLQKGKSYVSCAIGKML